MNDINDHSKNIINRILTEQINFTSNELDTKSTNEIVNIFSEADKEPQKAVERVIPELVNAIDEITARLKLNGKLFYIGTGTSGRLGVLDASECPPTFCTSPDLKFIQAPADIFKIDYKKINGIEGWGDLSIENLKKAINKAKTISLNKFIYSIGIRHIGQENAKILASFFKSIDNFSILFIKNKRSEILNNLKDLDGIGEIQIKSIDSFFSNKKNTMVVDHLIKVLKIDNFQISNKKGKFSNKNLMFTGGFKKMSRSEAKTLTENNGGKVLGSISKKLDILVVGDSKPTKKK